MNDKLKLIYASQNGGKNIRLIQDAFLEMAKAGHSKIEVTFRDQELIDQAKKEGFDAALKVINDSGFEMVSHALVYARSVKDKVLK